MRKSGNVEGNEIEIGGCTPKRFQQFLEFIYTDKFQVDIAGALDLLELSHKYKVQPLTEKCEELLQTEIPIKDSVKVFQAVRHHGRRELMDRAGQIMVKSFVELARSDALANAEEETLIYLLERDDLAVKEVELFKFILDWGRHKVGASADNELLGKTLKRLVAKIRFTNMAPNEFTKLVVPTGLLSAEETISVYSYLSGDEITRGGLNIKFNTSHRKEGTRPVVSNFLDISDGECCRRDLFPAFSKHCLSFKVDQTQVNGKLLPEHLLRKTFVTKLYIWTPEKHHWSNYGYHVRDLNVSIRDYDGSVQSGRSTTRFQRNPLIYGQYGWNGISVEPPVELMFGRAYSVIVEDHTAFDFNFRMKPRAAWGPRVSSIKQEAHVDFEGVRVTSKQVHRETDFFADKLPKYSVELLLIQGIEIELQ